MVTERVPGRDGHEVPERQRGADQRVDAHAGRDARDAGVGIDADAAGAPAAVERGCVEHGAAGVLGRVAVAPAEAAGDQAPPPAPREQGVDVGVVVGCDDERGGGRGAPPAGEELDGARGQPWTPSANDDDPEHAEDLDDPVAEHDLLGRAAAALLDHERVAEHREHERDDRQAEPRGVAGRRRVLERPEAVRGEHDARRDRAHVAEVGVGVVGQRAAVTVRRVAQLELLGVALAGDHEQRAGAGDDEEPVGERDAGRDTARDGAEHEAGGDRGEVDDRLVLEPQRVRDGDREVRGDDAGELAVVDRARR